MERYTIKDYERYRKEQDEKAAREADERRVRTEKESARRSWLADGGSANDFEHEWPSLRNQARRQRVVDADQKARVAHRATGISQI